jgi:hypothetical protein
MFVACVGVCARGSRVRVKARQARILGGGTTLGVIPQAPDA